MRDRPETEDRTGQFAAACADEPVQAEDLARVHAQADPAVSIGGRDVVELERGFGVVVDAACIQMQVGVGAPDHQGHDVVAGVTGERLRLRDASTVAQHRHRVGDGEHLFQSVADQHDGVSLIAQRTHHRVEAVGLVTGE